MQVLAANQSLVAPERLSRSVKEGREKMGSRDWAALPTCHRMTLDLILGEPRSTNYPRIYTPDLLTPRRSTVRFDDPRIA